MITRIVCSIFALGLAYSAFAIDLTDAQRAEIEARIKPVGESCMQGDSSCGGAAAARPPTALRRSGSCSSR